MSKEEIVLSEGLRTIGREAFRCSALLCIKIPSTVNFFALHAFMGSDLLRNVSISPASKLTQDMYKHSFPSLSSMDITLDMIMQRFDQLPLYRFCFDYHSSKDTQAGDNTSNAEINQQVARLSAHGLQQDCLGMTPLHILACSSRGHSVEIYKCMIKKYPIALLIKDLWGDIPLTYALYANASIEVIHFLFQTHRQMWGAMPFDFGDMIMMLAKNEGTSAELLRNVIWAQRVHFPALRVDWNEIMDSVDIGMYRVLVEASVSSRHICMSEEHHAAIDARVCEIRDEAVRSLEEDIDVNEGTIIQYYVEISDLITNYARLYHEHLQEATTILELALWKAMILRSNGDKQELTRVGCRAEAGCCAEVVIKLVLTFL